MWDLFYLQNLRTEYGEIPFVADMSNKFQL